MIKKRKTKKQKKSIKKKLRGAGGVPGLGRPSLDIRLGARLNKAAQKKKEEKLEAERNTLRKSVSRSSRVSDESLAKFQSNFKRGVVHSISPSATPNNLRRLMRGNNGRTESPKSLIMWREALTPTPEKQPAHKQQLSQPFSRSSSQIQSFMREPPHVVRPIPILPNRNLSRRNHSLDRQNPQLSASQSLKSSMNQVSSSSMDTGELMSGEPKIQTVHPRQ